MNYEYINAKNELISTVSENTCNKFFQENGCILESAYYELLHHNSSRARQLFLKIEDYDIRAHWGAFLAALCESRAEGYPSYFELRNFYEIDLNLLLTNFQGDYVEEVCKYSDWLKTINPEIYKYTARVFLKNNYTDLGVYFLEKAKDYYYNDPELHYLIAEYFVTVGDYKKAQKYITSCLKTLPEYFPAISLQEKIAAYL